MELYCQTNGLIQILQISNAKYFNKNIIHFQILDIYF